MHLASCSDGQPPVCLFETPLKALDVSLAKCIYKHILRLFSGPLLLLQSSIVLKKYFNTVSINCFFVVLVVPQCCDQRKRHAWRPHDPPLLQHRPHLRVPPRLPEGAGSETSSLVGAPSLHAMWCTGASVSLDSLKDKIFFCLSPGRVAPMLTLKVTTRELVMWCWRICALWRFVYFHSFCNPFFSITLRAKWDVLYLIWSPGIHQLPSEARRGVDRAGESLQEAEEAGDGLQRVWAAEGLLPATQHIPAQAHPAPHALQTHPRETMQALFPNPSRSWRLQGWVFLHYLQCWSS